MLTKHNVCLFIKDEEHLEEMREFLESKGEFYDNEINSNSLQSDINNKYIQYSEIFEIWMLDDSLYLNEVTTEQFKKLWEI